LGWAGDCGIILSGVFSGVNAVTGEIADRFSYPIQSNVMPGMDRTGSYGTGRTGRDYDLYGSKQSEGDLGEVFFRAREQNLA
jgi:hypothetical protein